MGMTIFLVVTLIGSSVGHVREIKYPFKSMIECEQFRISPEAMQISSHFGRVIDMRCVLFDESI